MSSLFAILAAAVAVAPPPVSPTALPYGPPITPDQARAVANAAEVETIRRGVDVAAIAVVDPAGRIVYFERQDNATFGNTDMASRKARSSARLRRPTSGDAARLKAGDQILLLVPDAFPADGGQPIVKNGQVIGAVGIAGSGDDATTALVAAKAVD